MELSEYRVRLREHLHDPDGKVFSDDEIDKLLDHAVESYCFDSMAFCGDFDCMVEADGTCAMPDNYLGFIAGWNMDGNPVISVSTTELAHAMPDYAVQEGLGEYVTDDNSSAGIIRVYPNPYSVQGDTIYGTEDYGLMGVDTYGTIDNTESYGIATQLRSFTVTMTIHYTKLETIGNVDDPAAVIFRAAADAFIADGDFQSTEKAEIYEKLYQQRIALRKIISNVPRAVRRSGKFF